MASGDKSITSSKKSSGDRTRGRSHTSSRAPQQSGHQGSSSKDFWKVVMLSEDVGDNGRDARREKTMSQEVETKKRNKKKPTVAKQYQCKLCPASFERTGHLHAHIETVHERKKPHACPYGCGKVFAHKSSLGRHIRGYHETSESSTKKPLGRNGSSQQPK